MKLEELYSIVQSRLAENKEESYIASLSRAGADRIIQKVGEEAVEVVIAAKNTDKSRLVGECADLLFHLIILMCKKQVLLSDIERELNDRRK